MLTTRESAINYILASRLSTQEIKYELKNNKLQVKKLNPAAQLPKRQSLDDAGYDIYTIESKIIPAGKKEIFSTGIAIQLPECPIRDHVYCFYLVSRSGLSAKYGVEKGAGLIDKPYTGELKVILYNHSETDYTVQAGDRIAQGIIIAVATYEVVEVDKLLETNRGANGFGSTGL